MLKKVEPFKETDTHKIFKVYSRFYQDGKSVYKVEYLSLIINKVKSSISLLSSKKQKYGGKWIYDKTRIKKYRLPASINFKVINGKLLSYSNKRDKTKDMIDLIMSLSKYTQRKINRILKQEFFPNFKITESFAYNINLVNAPNVIEFIPKDQAYSDIRFLNRFAKKEINWKTFVGRVCGSKGKKTIKTLSSLKDIPTALRNLSYAKGILSHGEINNLLDSWGSAVPSLPKTDLYKINKNLLFDRNPLSISYANDIENLLRAIESRQVEISSEDIKSTFLETHDHLSELLGKVAEKNIIFPKYEFDGITSGELSLQVCPDLDTLKAWSKYMSNCISGYSNRILNKTDIMCGVFINEVLTYNANFRVDRKKIYLTEVKARFNKELTADEFKEFKRLSKKIESENEL